MHYGDFDTTRKDNHSSFLTPTVVGGRRPIRLKFALKATHPFEKRRLRQISTVKDSEKSSIVTTRKLTTGFRTTYSWSACVTPKSSKGWLKKRFFCFLDKIQFQSNRVCYKVFLCENFQQQGSSMTIPPSNGP